jgi:hypothetical protein
LKNSIAALNEQISFYIQKINKELVLEVQTGNLPWFRYRIGDDIENQPLNAKRHQFLIEAIVQVHKDQDRQITLSDSKEFASALRAEAHKENVQIYDDGFAFLTQNQKRQRAKEYVTNLKSKYPGKGFRFVNGSLEFKLMTWAEAQQLSVRVTNFQPTQ